MTVQFLTWHSGFTESFWGALALFVAGAALLIKGGDWFVDSAVGIAKGFRIPELIIGATVVSVGTTLPEVMVSVTAALRGNGAIAYGNAIGSIICNTALIAAITVAIRPGAVDRQTISLPVLFFFGAAAVYMVAAYVFGSFDRWLGLVLLLIFGAYLAVTARKGLRARSDAPVQKPTSGNICWKDPVFLLVGAGAIAVGADMLESASVALAAMAGIPTEVVGVTVVALCTSLPELTTAVTALVKGHGALSLGNVIGANVFNLVLVSGAAAAISPFQIPEGSQFMGCSTSLLLELPAMVGVMGLLTLPALARGRLCRWQGVTLLGIYGAFIAAQVLVALG